jgi:hypothetical protein
VPAHLHLSQISAQCHAPRIKAHDTFKRRLDVPARAFCPLTLQVASLSGSPASEARDCLCSGPQFSHLTRIATMADVKIEMPQDEVDEIIRNKRKARDPKGLFLHSELWKA